MHHSSHKAMNVHATVFGAIYLKNCEVQMLLLQRTALLGALKMVWVDSLTSPTFGMKMVVPSVKWCAKVKSSCLQR